MLPTQYVVDLVGIEPTGPKSTVLQTAEANHIAHKIQNLVRHVGFEPTALCSKADALPGCANDGDYRLRCPVSALGTFVSHPN